MADTKISAAADIGTVNATDMLPVARSGSTTAYHATMAELASFAGGAFVPNYATSPPAMDGTAAPGTANTTSRGDHRHPIDTTRAPLDSPAFTGTPSLPAGTTAITAAPGDSDTSVATTAFVQAALGAAGAGVSSWNTRTGAVSLTNSDVTTVLPASTTTPLMDGAANAGAGTTWARADHVHPTDTGIAAAEARAQNNVGRNLLHNGRFEIAQRGAGPFTAQSYTLDRWVVGVTLDAISITQAVISDGGRGQIGDEAAQLALQNSFTGNAGATAVNYVEQRTEDVRRLAGKTVTVSFWAIAGAAGVKLGANLFQIFGTGGSPSAAVTVLATGASFTLTTSWVRYSFTAAVPSVAGKTLGTNGDSATLLRLYYSAGANAAASSGNIGVQSGAVQLWGIQLEIGSVATPLEKRDIQQERALCQRFYQIGSLQLGGIASTAGGANYFLPFATTMRAAPTSTVNMTTQTNCSGAGLGSLTPAGGLAFANVTASGGFVFSGTYTASADL